MNSETIKLAPEPARGRPRPEEGGTRRLVQGLRERMGLTQEKLAARLGVTFPTINRWENGHTRPSPLARKQIEALLRGLGDEGQDLLIEHFGPDPRL